MKARMDWAPTQARAVQLANEAFVAAKYGSPRKVRKALHALNDLLTAVCLRRVAWAVEMEHGIEHPDRSVA